MAVIQTSNLAIRIKGDTFKSVQFTFQDNLGAGIDLTGATLRCQFRSKTKTGVIALDISSGSGITVTDATNGVFVIDEFTPLTWDVDTYFYDVQTTFADATIKTYIQGDVKVVQDTTFV